MFDAYLVKPEISTLKRAWIHMASNYSALDLDHDIYVPNMFILGSFKEREDNFELSDKRMFYNTNMDLVLGYETALKERELKIVKKLTFDEDFLRRIMKQAEIHNSSAFNISSGLVSFLKKD